MVALSPEYRDSALAALAGAELDVLVVGGGVVGAGCALDAATRGLTVGLVEARDLASGTSSRSSKLIHGGLRYLEQLEFGLVHEALRERGLLATRLAPHLVRPLPILVPLTGPRGPQGLEELPFPRPVSPGSQSQAPAGPAMGPAGPPLPAGSVPTSVSPVMPPRSLCDSQSGSTKRGLWRIPLASGEP